MRHLLAFASVLVACEESGNDPAFPGIAPCLYNDTPVAWDEATPAGPTLDELLEGREGTHVLTGGFTDRDEEITVTLAFERRGDGATWRENTSGGCGSYLQIPARSTLQGDRIDIDRSGLAVTGWQASPDELVMQADLDPDRPGIDLPEPEDGTVRGVTFEVSFGAGGAKVAIDLLTEGGDLDGNGDGVAWAGQETVFVAGPR